MGLIATLTTTMIVTALHCNELKKLLNLQNQNNFLRLKLMMKKAAPVQKLLVRCSWDVVSGRSKGVEQTVDGATGEEDLSVERAVFAAIIFVEERNKEDYHQQSLDWSVMERGHMEKSICICRIAYNMTK